MLSRYYNVKFSLISILEVNNDMGGTIKTQAPKLDGENKIILTDGIMTKKSGSKNFLQEKKTIESTHELMIDVANELIYEVDNIIKIENNNKFNGEYIILDIDIDAGDRSKFQVLSLKNNNVSTKD